MSKYGTYIYIDEESLREYLAHCKRKLLGKEYEVGAAILMKNFFEIEYNSPCLVGFKIKEKFLDQYSGEDNEFTLDRTRKLIEEHTDEDYFSDVSIFPLSTYNKAKNSNKAWLLQFKRFGHYQEKTGTKPLLETLTKISKKYAQNPATLVFFFDGSKSVDPKIVFDHIQSLNFPFKEVMYIWTDSEKEKIHIGFFWPKNIVKTFNAQDLVTKRKNL